MDGKRRAVCVVTCILWAVPLICMAGGFILLKTGMLGSLAEKIFFASDSTAPLIAVYAVGLLYFAQIIGYVIHVIRQKNWNDIGRKYFWVVAIVSFGYFMIPIYWYRFILNKDSPYYR